MNIDMFYNFVRVPVAYWIVWGPCMCISV